MVTELLINALIEKLIWHATEYVRNIASSILKHYQSPVNAGISFLTEMTKKSNIVLVANTRWCANSVFFPTPSGVVFSPTVTPFIVRR